MSFFAREDNQGKRIVSVVFLGLALLFIWSLVLNLVDLLGAGDRLSEVEEEVAMLEEENQKLEESLAWLSTREAVEKNIRDKLGLVKPGEIVVLVPEELKQQQEGEVETGEEILEVWRKWLEVFFDF